MTIRAHRLVAAGALTVAAVAAPIAIALTTVEASGVAQCRSWVSSNGSDPVCADGPDGGNSYTIGSPDFGVYGPNTGLAPGAGGPGIGFNSGPLLPGQTWRMPVG